MVSHGTEGRTSGPELDEAPPATPLNPPRPWYRKPQWVITTIAIVGLLIIALLLWWSPWHTVRVTDGSELLAEDLADVLGKIHIENERVTDSSRPWVSIALILPIRTTDDARNNQEDVRRHLQGAYLAQYWSNNPNGENKFSNNVPLIRLLIADTGQDGQEWRDTVAQLVDMADPESGEHLVAATGLGLSTDATQETINALADENIPMVGSVITATELAAPGLFRVAPTNSDQAAAMFGYLRGTEEWRSASTAEPYKTYLIQDRAQDDTYVEDLGNQYRREFPNDGTHRLLDAQGDYDSQKEGAGNAIANQISTICSIRPRVVFFAGRSDGLRTFLSELAGRTCTDARITVVTGAGASNIDDPVPTTPLWIEENANFDVLYTALASPQTWQEQYQESVLPDTAERFKRCANCFAALFPDPLDDGGAIMAHDAVLTTVDAARNAASQEQPQPTADALINGLYQITWTNPVPGASGWIYFQRAPGIPEGVPYNKAVPIMQLNPDGTVAEIALSSRFGTSPAKPRPPH